ncbi:MAG: FtsX-like permease family protein [Saprospiraceae bacterium]|nr:FtsX-like permease family protein [Saprospiraceae bacterium]
MRFSPFLAVRYLFARKSTNVIHLLAGLSILGMGIGAAALVLVMAVFNGFESLVFGLSNQFNPDIHISPREGKTFFPDSLWLGRIQQDPSVVAISHVLEENALFTYGEVQDIGVLKGVDKTYASVTEIDSFMLVGNWNLDDPTGSVGIIGAGMASKLGVDTRNAFESLVVYMPNRKRTGPFDQPFLRRFLPAAGIFSIQLEVDMQYVLTDLAFVQTITGRRGALSALEIAIQPNANSKQTVKRIQSIAGSDFVVKDRIGQEESFLRIMNIEKWVAFAIMCLILLLVAFNVAGTLWMMVTEKRPDIAILKTMGATSSQIQKIFLYNGLLLCGVAFLLGTVVALAFYGLQQNYGLIPVPPGFIIDAYPMEIRWPDFFVVLITVLSIGSLAAWLPARRAARVDAIIQEE